MAHPKHEQVRLRYHRRCGYCGVSEDDAGSEFTVDHYQPRSSGGDESDHNLVYACFRCNQYKGTFFPNREQLDRGQRVLHPLKDDISVHLQENELTGWVEPNTETGRFHIILLQLNRAALVQYRLRQRLAAAMEAENTQLRTTVEVQRELITRLRQQFGIAAPESE